MDRKNNIKLLMVFHIVIMLFSLFGMASKLAAMETFFSAKFLFFYCITLINLFLFAVLWQQFLKQMALTTAYANKAATIGWTLIFGYVFFDEAIGFWQFLGMFIIILGIYLVVSDEEKAND